MNPNNPKYFKSNNNSLQTLLRITFYAKKAADEIVAKHVRSLSRIIETPTKK